MRFQGENVRLLVLCMKHESEPENHPNVEDMLEVKAVRT